MIMRLSSLITFSCISTGINPIMNITRMSQEAPHCTYFNSIRIKALKSIQVLLDEQECSAVLGMQNR